MTTENHKNLLIQRAHIMAAFLKMQGFHLDYTFNQRPETRKKIKIGFLSNGYLSPTETTGTLPCYKYLDRSRFNIVLLSLYETGRELENYCKSFADEFIHLQGTSLIEWANKIRQQDLDILFPCTNLTMVMHQTALLGLFRLARIQIGNGVSARTTGMPYYDYFLSGSLTEPKNNAQSHYSEKLILIEGSHHCYDFSHQKDKTTINIDRKGLGIPENAIMYCAGASYNKITPELEASWIRIITSVPHAYLILYPFNPNWSENSRFRPFTVRITKNFQTSNIGERLRIVNICGRENVRQIIRISDIYLDSFPFSGPTSILDALETGTPPISTLGNTFRSMASGGILQDLGLPELVKDNIAEYINFALKIGIDNTLRASLRVKIKETMDKNPIVFNAQAYGVKIGDAFEKIFYDSNIKQPKKLKK